MDDISQYNGTLKVRQVHLTQFLQQLPMILFGHLIAAIAVSIVVDGRVSRQTLQAWIATFFCVILGRSVMYLYQTSRPTNPRNYPYRFWSQVFAAGCLGSLWGSMAFMLIGQSVDRDALLIVMVLLGLVASSVASTANIKSVFIAFSACTLLPAVVKFLIIGGSQYTFLALLILLFLIVTIIFERGVHNALTESIQLRFDYDKLIETLTQEKQRAESTKQNVETLLGEAEKANQAKTQFLAAASHDLRQPLHALRLLSSTLLSSDLGTKQKPLVTNICSSVESLEELLNSLLDLSKLDAGTQTVELRTLYLSDIFANLNRTHASVAVERKIEFSMEDSNAIVHTDILLLERLLSNLISNAIRYSPRGAVSVSTSQSNNACKIYVRDNGRGINEEDQSRIFEEFVQLENPERDRSKGIGLGLAIVKQTADLLQLPLTLESSPGVGSVFCIAVPLGNSSNLAQVNLPQESLGEDLAGLVVLVIDDEVAGRNALDALLDSWGCVGLLASDGDEAERVVREIEATPDAIIADLRLRDNETGVDVIARVHKIFDTPCPSIIVTGDTAPARLRELKALPYPILHKPCAPHDLRQFLSNAMVKNKP